MKVIVVIGPTSVGKTSMGIALAKQFNGEVISGDSMQIYKHMDIGTAKVTVEEMDGVIHHLIDVKSPFDDYSVAEFQKTVREKIKDICSRHKTPIIVGGTGLYIKAALYDYEFSETQDDAHIMINEKYKDYSNEELYARLVEIDSKSAEILHPNNRRRVLRAIEIYELTGQKKSEIVDEQVHQPIYETYFVGLTLDRAILYERINHRVDLMREAGLEKEIQSLIDMGLQREHQSAKAIGYKEWFDYYEHLISKEEVYELIKQHSRNYAKRQYTWFKNQFDVHWYNVNLNDFNETINQVSDDLKVFLEG